MPRKRISGKRRRGELTGLERMDLILGAGRVGWSSRERREAWEDNADVLMAEVNPGTRPAAFWDYEGYEKIPFESDLQALDRLNLLTDREKSFFSLLGWLPTVPADGRDPREVLYSG